MFEAYIVSYLYRDNIPNKQIKNTVLTPAIDHAVGVNLPSINSRKKVKIGINGDAIEIETGCNLLIAFCNINWGIIIKLMAEISIG